MSKFSSTEIVPRLVKEFGYSSDDAEAVAGNLVATQPQVQDAFLHWWKSGEIPALEVEQYNVQRLVDEYDMNPIAALLTLDWLIREPEDALATLARGYDWVEWPDE